MNWFTLGAFCFCIVGLSLACCWFRAAALNGQATAAYRAGNRAEGDRLVRRARRWELFLRTGKS